MAADRLQGPEFWLPSEFLTDEDFLLEKENFRKKNDPIPEFCFPTEFPFDFGNYALASPETESDDEDLLAALTRQLTRSSFLPSHHQINPTKNQNLEKGWVMSGSPQSTLTQVGSWSGRSTVRSNAGSPNAPSLLPSPPATPFGVNNKPRDLIYQHTGQVSAYKPNVGDGFPGPPRILPQHQYPQKSTNSPVFNNTRFQQVKMAEQFMMNPQYRMWYSQQLAAYQSRPTQKVGVGGASAVAFGGYFGGVRAGLGGGGGAKKGCAGTGVFLPRRYGCNDDKNAFPSDSRKKLVGSNASLPDKVLDALNKNFIDMNCHSPSLPRFNTGFISEHDALKARRNALLVQQQLGLSLSARGGYPPKDWTY